MIDNSFSALALETFIPNSFNLTYDCFVGPCVGFKHIGIIHNYNFVNNSTIILYSDNDTQLNWCKMLHQKWTGNLYQLWGMLQDYISHTNSVLNFPPIMENKQINSVYLDQIYSEYGLDMDLLMEKWRRIQRFKWIFLKDNNDMLLKSIQENSKHALYLYDDQNKLKNLMNTLNKDIVIENNIGVRKHQALDLLNA